MALFLNLKELNLSDPFMKALKAVNSINNSSDSLSQEDLKKQRASMEKVSKLGTPVVGVYSEPLTINGISCEWTKPEATHNPNTVILYAHGGGYTCGGLSYARILASKLAINCGIEVVSFDYRLAPEHKYPAALEDGLTVYDALLHMGYGAKNIILAGDSAGGNLVLCMTQRIIADNRMAPKALLLFSPWTDMTASSPTYEEQRDNDPILTYEYVVAVRSAFAGKDADFTDPSYSPLFGAFDGFPPTLVQVGKNEILLNDSVALAKKINKAGGNATIKIYKDGWHVFQQMPTRGASKAMAEVGTYVSSILYN